MGVLEKLLGRKSAKEAGETEGFISGWNSGKRYGYQAGRQKVPWEDVKYDLYERHESKKERRKTWGL